MHSSWSRCRRVAAVEPAHGASVKSVASGRWPIGGKGGTLSSTGAASSDDDDASPTFASAGMDGVTRVWRLMDGGSDGVDPARASPMLKCLAVLEGHAAGVRAVAMPPRFGEATDQPRTTSPSSSRRDAHPPPRRHRPRQEQPRRGRRAPRALVATASYDRTVRLWHGAKDAPAFPTLQGHSDYVLSAAFSPGGEILATGGADG